MRKRTIDRWLPLLVVALAACAATADPTLGPSSDLPCEDADGDGYGEGDGCTGFDCDDTNATLALAEDCEAYCGAGDVVREGCPCNTDYTVCYDGPPDTLGVGRCWSGISSCVDGRFGPCVGQRGPQIETCGDNIDEDCDGLRDETCPDVPDECPNEAPPCEGFMLTEDFEDDYDCGDLGSVEGIPFNYGGLTFSREDPNLLLIGGSANVAAGALYAVEVERGCDDHVIGFRSAAEHHLEAAYNDGGVAWGPDGVLLLSRWPVNELGQVADGSDETKILSMATFGVAYSHAALAVVPAGWDGEGLLKMLSWPNGQMYEAELVPDGDGTFDLAELHETGVSLPGGPEGFVHVPRGSPAFDEDSLLVSEFTADKVTTYEVDGNGDPDVDTRRDFLAGLSGAEGATIDPVSGDFLFCTFGRFEGTERDIVVVVRGFAPPPPAFE